MLQSDVHALNELLAPELIFTNHLGQILTKQDDLLAHETKILKIETLTISEERIQLIGDTAIVNIRAYILGHYAGVTSANDFRFTRIWALTASGTWHVVAAHSCIIV